MIARVILTAALLAGARQSTNAQAGSTTWFPNGLAPTNIGQAAPSAGECGKCHLAQHSDWLSSRHGQAWTNAIFQREYKDRPLDWCIHCHAPLPEQLQEIRSGGGLLANEGVTCAACHIRQGEMISRKHAASSPHQTRVDAAFGGPDFCAGCHQFNFPLEGITNGRLDVVGYTDFPMQSTIAQHASSPYAAQECLDCHRSGDGGHRFPGGHDLNMLKRATEVESCRSSDNTIRITLRNRGAGHHLPTGDVHRHIALRAWFSNSPERLAETIFGRQFEAVDSGGKRLLQDTRLPAGTSREMLVSFRKLGGKKNQPLHVEARLVWTIDEFPFRGRELPVPTSMVMYSADLQWQQLPRCVAQK